MTVPAIPRWRRIPEETRHILVGAGVLVLLIAVFAVLAGRGASPVNGYQVVARFSNVDGIFVGSPVRLAGVRIGGVATLDYDSRTRRAVVTMDIRADIRMPTDSIAIVTSEGLLGDRFIRLDPGGSLDMLADGDKIEFTQGSIMFTELLAKVIMTVERKRRAAAGGEKPADAVPGNTGIGQ